MPCGKHPARHVLCVHGCRCQQPAPATQQAVGAPAPHQTPHSCLRILLVSLQALFWSRVFADIGGRLASGALPLTSPPALLALGALKLGLAPLLPLYICGGLPWLSTSWVEGDAAALAFVTLQWLVSGYVNSCCALAAPRLVRPALARRGASLMALVFQAGCLAGLLGALPLQRWVGG